MMLKLCYQMNILSNKMHVSPLYWQENFFFSLFLSLKEKIKLFSKKIMLQL